MRRLARFNLAQRIVTVIALAGLLRTIGVHLVEQLARDGGWFSYAPLSEGPPFDGPYTGWRSVGATLVWIVLIVAWAAFSIWLFGLPHQRDADAGPD